MIKHSAKIILAALLLAVTCVGIYSCKKEGTVTPPPRAFFLGAATGNYQITAPSVVFKIPVGVTNVEQADRTVNISVSSSTGAVAGTHYNIPASIVIPAGKSVDTLVVAAVYNQYLAGRKDVLEITVSGGVQSATFSNKVTLNVSGPCFEGSIVLAELVGDYDQSFDPGYGPYTTSVLSATSTGPTSALVTIANIFDLGWDDLDFTIDWSNPASPTLTYVPQPTGMDGGTLNAAVAGHEVWIYPPTTGSMGAYSYCNKTFTITYRLCMPTFGACFTGTVTTDIGK